MNYEIGQKVGFVHPAMRERFGEGPFTVDKFNPHTGSVELKEIGNVAVSDIHPIKEESEVQRVVAETPSQPQVEFHQASQPRTSEEAAIRMEALCGSLLSHPDPNVRMIARELLSILWENSS